MERWGWLLPFFVTLLVLHSSGQSEELSEDDPVGAEGHRKEQDCPCILSEQCPRVYGISELDFKELGTMEPCDDSEMVRCCGVTVSVVRKEDSDENEESEDLELTDEEEEEFSDTLDTHTSDDTEQGDDIAPDDLSTSESREHFVLVESPEGHAYSTRRTRAPGARVRPTYSRSTTRVWEASTTDNPPTDQPNASSHSNSPGVVEPTTDGYRVPSLQRFKPLNKRPKPGYSARGAKTQPGDHPPTKDTSESVNSDKNISPPPPPKVPLAAVILTKGNRVSPMKKLKIPFKPPQLNPSESEVSEKPRGSETKSEETLEEKKPVRNLQKLAEMPKSPEVDVNPQPLPETVTLKPVSRVTEDAKRTPPMKKLRFPYPRVPLGSVTSETVKNDSQGLSDGEESTPKSENVSEVAPTYIPQTEVSPVMMEIKRVSPLKRFNSDFRRRPIGSSSTAESNLTPQLLIPTQTETETSESYPTGESSLNKPIRVAYLPENIDHSPSSNPSDYSSNYNYHSTAPEEPKDFDSASDHDSEVIDAPEEEYTSPVPPPMPLSESNSPEKLETPLRRKPGTRRKLVRRLKPTPPTTESPPVQGAPITFEKNEEAYHQEQGHQDRSLQRTSSESTSEKPPVETNPPLIFGNIKRVQPLIKSRYSRPRNQMQGPAVISLSENPTTQSVFDGQQTHTVQETSTAPPRLIGRPRGTVYGRVRFPSSTERIQTKPEPEVIPFGPTLEIEKVLEVELHGHLNSHTTHIQNRPDDKQTVNKKDPRVQMTSTYSRIRENTHKDDSIGSADPESDKVHKGGSDYESPSTPIASEGSRFSVPKTFVFLPGSSPRPTEQDSMQPPTESTLDQSNHRLTFSQNNRGLINNDYKSASNENNGSPANHRHTTQTKYTLNDNKISLPVRGTFPEVKDYDLVLNSENRKNRLPTPSAKENVPTTPLKTETYNSMYSQNSNANINHNPSLNSFVDFDEMESQQRYVSQPSVMKGDSDWHGVPNNWNGLQPDLEESRIKETYYSQQGQQNNQKSQSSSESNRPVPQKRIRIKMKKTDGHFNPSIPSPRPTYSNTESLLQAVDQSPDPVQTSGPSQTPISENNGKPGIQFDTISTNSEINSSPNSPFRFPPFRRSEAKHLPTPSPSPPIIKFVSTRRPPIRITDTKFTPEVPATPESLQTVKINHSELVRPSSPSISSANSDDRRPERFNFKSVNSVTQKETETATNSNTRFHVHELGSKITRGPVFHPSEKPNRLDIRPTESSISHQIPATESVFVVNSVRVEPTASGIVDRPGSPSQISGGNGHTGSMDSQLTNSVSNSNGSPGVSEQTETVSSSNIKNHRFPTPQKFNFTLSSTKSEVKVSHEAHKSHQVSKPGSVRFPNERPSVNSDNSKKLRRPANPTVQQQLPEASLGQSLSSSAGAPGSAPMKMEFNVPQPIRLEFGNVNTNAVREHQNGQFLNTLGSAGMVPPTVIQFGSDNFNGQDVQNQGTIRKPIPFEHYQHQPLEQNFQPKPLDLPQVFKPFERNQNRPIVPQLTRPFEPQSNKPFEQQSNRPTEQQHNNPFEQQQNIQFEHQHSRPMERQQHRPTEQLQNRPMEQIRHRPMEQLQNRPVEQLQTRPMHQLQNLPMEHQQSRPMLQQQQQKIPMEPQQNRPMEQQQHRPMEEQLQNRPMEQQQNRLMEQQQHRPMEEQLQNRPMEQQHNRPMEQQQHRPMEQQHRPMEQQNRPAEQQIRPAEQQNRPMEQQNRPMEQQNRPMNQQHNRPTEQQLQQNRPFQQQPNRPMELHSNIQGQQIIQTFDNKPFNPQPPRVFEQGQIRPFEEPRWPFDAGRPVNDIKESNRFPSIINEGGQLITMNSNQNKNEGNRGRIPPPEQPLIRFEIKSPQPPQINTQQNVRFRETLRPQEAHQGQSQQQLRNPEVSNQNMPSTFPEVQQPMKSHEQETIRPQGLSQSQGVLRPQIQVENDNVRPSFGRGQSPVILRPQEIPNPFQLEGSMTQGKLEQQPLRSQQPQITHESSRPELREQQRFPDPMRVELHEQQTLRKPLQHELREPQRFQERPRPELRESQRFTDPLRVELHEQQILQKPSQHGIRGPQRSQEQPRFELREPQRFHDPLQAEPGKPQRPQKLNQPEPQEPQRLQKPLRAELRETQKFPDTKGPTIPQPVEVPFNREPTQILIEMGEVKQPMNPDIRLPNTLPQSEKPILQQQQINYGPIQQNAQPSYVPFGGYPQTGNVGQPVQPSQMEYQQQRPMQIQQSFQQQQQPQQQRRPTTSQMQNQPPLLSFFNRIRNPTRTSRNVDFTTDDDNNPLKSTDDLLASASTDQTAPEERRDLNLDSDIKDGTEVHDSKDPTGQVPKGKDGKDDLAKTDKKKFKPPKVIQRGFHPILPYSEKDPGLTLVPIPPKRDTITPPQPKLVFSTKGPLHHPNSLGDSNFNSKTLT